ncbi:proton-coupled amino acid transporter-like protein pathetic [Leguminivora glycinivorella]|uniref:proton-coupled amino acid transporter-like protein pathetic n=1 Tax=Leguminivora glycinivorella TaxID=1035111 RepID=UPI00200D1643|nr:proton-coupled amino acid transporter-like protein pathetic [Leguminivora glycinivorella]
MIYVTHAVNFFMPFNCVWFYIRKRIKPERHYKMELVSRAISVIIISSVAIAFPTIDSLMSFLGCFCLSNMAFICPNIIYVLVHYERPGKNKNWLIIRAVLLSVFGVFILVCGTLITGADLFGWHKDATTKAPVGGGAGKTPEPPKGGD